MRNWIGIGGAAVLAVMAGGALAQGTGGDQMGQTGQQTGQQPGQPAGQETGQQPGQQTGQQTGQQSGQQTDAMDLGAGEAAVSAGQAGETGQAGGQDAMAVVDTLHGKFEDAFNAGDADQVADLYAEDAVLMSPMGETAQSREDVAETLRRGISERKMSNLSIETMEARRLGEAIFETGSYTAEAESPDGQAVAVEGDYATLLEQQGGDWKITRHIFNETIGMDEAVAEEPR